MTNNKVLIDALKGIIGENQPLPTKAVMIEIAKDALASYAEQAAPTQVTGKSAGVWIRASDKIPDHDHPLHVKIDSIRRMGNFLQEEDGIYFFVSGSASNWIIPQTKFSEIEWLDEGEAGKQPESTAGINHFKQMIDQYCLASLPLVFYRDEQGNLVHEEPIADDIHIEGWGDFDFIVQALDVFKFDMIDKEGVWSCEVFLKRFSASDYHDALEVVAVNASYIYSLADHEAQKKEIAAFESTEQPEQEPAVTLGDVLREEISFSDQAFGKNRPFTGPLHHLKKEIQEVLDADTEPYDPTNGSLIEFADCQLLLLDAFRRRHPDLSADDLLRTCMNKISINRKRKWGMPDKNGVVEHIRDEGHTEVSGEQKGGEQP